MRPVVLLLSAFLLLTGCGKTFEWKSELTLHFMTPNGPVTASSVTLQQTKICDGWCTTPGQPGGTARGRIYGEALFASLGDKYLFVLLETTAHRRWSYEEAFADRGLDGIRAWTRAMMRNRDISGAVPRKYYPRLVAFENLADPTSIFEVDPDDLVASFWARLRA